MVEAKRCTRCDEGVLTNRMPKYLAWLCPNKECLYSPPGPDPVRILHAEIPWPDDPMREWERSARDGLWYWAQVR